MKSWIMIILVFSFCKAQAQETDSSIYKSFNPPCNKIKISTGFNKVKETNQQVISLILPSAAIAYGFISLQKNTLRKLNISTKSEITEDRNTPITKIDNYLQFSPVLAVYGLNALGIKGKNNLRDRTIIYVMSTVITTAMVTPLKHITKEERPDGSNNQSFPSGHTATAFAAAEFMRQEYKDVSPWYGVLGYGAAAATGILRLYNNKHWVGDVVAGAGFGVLSTKLAYWIYPAIKRKLFKDKPMNTMVMPFYQNHGGGLSVVYNFSH